MSIDDVLPFVAIIGPGFVFLKVLYVFGGQHRRLEWEWVVWSVLIGLVLSWVGTILANILAFWQGPVPRELAIGMVSFVLAVVFGGLAAAAWERLKQKQLTNTNARRLHRWVSDSAWDFVLDEADRRDNGVEVTVEVDGKEKSYYGSLDTYGQEVAEAKPYVYLTYVYLWDPKKGYLPMDKRTEGILFHQRDIKRMRFIARVSPQERVEPDYTEPAVAQAQTLVARPQDEPGAAPAAS